MSGSSNVIRPAVVILLAEDSTDDAFFFERALSKTCLDCSLMRAANGKMAIDILQKAQPNGAIDARMPDVMFLDLKMPVMSGFEVLEWLQLANLQPALKVLVLSGSNNNADRLRAMTLGAADYLVKPINFEVLRARIENLVEDKQAKGVATKAGS